MKQSYRNGVLFFAALIITAGVIYSFSAVTVHKEMMHRIRSSSSPHASIEMKKGREEYFIRLLRDPATGKIPPSIRQRELQYAEKINRLNKSMHKTTAAVQWHEAGPYDVGGRTRALAVDITNSNTILAGGASGGIWKSTDNGDTWVAKSSTSTILSVTTIAQDPRPGHTNTWYYGCGEFSGSGNDLGFTARFTGDGVYKSTDNGETWQVLPSTLSRNNTKWDSDFDYVSRIAVNPVNGDVYVASNGIGIYRSQDGGNTFNLVLGGVNHHVYSDVSIGSNGNMVAVLSRPFSGQTAVNTPGIYKSTNGTNWSKITAGGYPETSLRSVVQIAPSNTNVAYVLTHTGGTVNDREEMKFFKVNFSSGTTEDRSANLPDFSDGAGNVASNAFVTSQGGYDLVVAVKPDDENFVLIAGTCLFRSPDGFATKPSDGKAAWIGGYNPTSFMYPNLHPDVHSFSFDPNDPKKMWWGHDGGLSYTTDITATGYATYFPWIDKNNGYNVTQFYHVSISSKAGDNRIMGGTQDNGTPFFQYTGSASTSSDVSSGDGSYSYMGNYFAYTSSQNGSVNRLKYDANGIPKFSSDWTVVTPTDAENQSFINPFCIDPNNENIMYYPAGNVLWRNNSLGSIPNYLQEGTMQGWLKLTGFTTPTGYTITTLAISKTPSGILYYGASSDEGAPKLYKVANAQTAIGGKIELALNAPAGAYIHNIAVNPDDANEIIVVLSNYNIIGLYHSTDGGQNFTAIEGNLEGTENNPGPSIRGASILPTGTGTVYYAATSVGLFSTTQLNGGSTNWVQEGSNVIGNVIVNYVTSRKSDGTVVAGTHGRGAFTGVFGGSSNPAVLNVNSNRMDIKVLPGSTNSQQISISNSGDEVLNYNITAVSNGFRPSHNLFPTFKPGPKIGVTRLENGMIPAGITAGRDSMYSDDGDNSADNFFGEAGSNFYWLTSYTTESDFSLEKIKLFMRTESSPTNSVYIAVSKIVDNVVQTALYETTVNFGTAVNGSWFEYTLPSAIAFTQGETIAITIGSMSTTISYPAGFDTDGSRHSNSYYYDSFWQSWLSLADFNSSTVNAAWLVRITGTGSGGGNLSPVADAVVSPLTASINQAVNFNASGSYDSDGSITSYLWEFGDGQTSNDAVTSHMYSEQGVYTYKLTVTDDEGAQSSAGGQVNVTDGFVRWSISPASGNVAAGASQPVTITFNSSGLAEGFYTAVLNISSNGGNQSIPVDIEVTSALDISDQQKNYSYILGQNYPNPFNPATTISWSVAKPGFVTLKVYNINGKEVTTLVDEYRQAGDYKTVLNTSGLNLASGVYFYKIVSGNFTETKKFMLLK